MVAVAAISSMGATKNDGDAFGPGDFFPALNEPLRLAGDAAATADASIADASGEMTTQDTVNYLKRGFARYVPPRFREYAGLGS